MLIIKLWNYFRGYAIIKITGENAERLLNQAALKGIYLWDIKRIDDKTLTAGVDARCFFKLSRLARKTGCHLSILRRKGIFFMINMLRRRRALVAGALLFIASIYFLSSFIWSIDVVSQDPEIKKAVEDDLRRWGLKEGTFKYGLDKKQYMDKILQQHKEIAWGEIKIKGSKLVVELVKKKLPPELEENSPCDIIASKDGIIEEIIPFKGEALVKPGDTVCAGDVLITGRIVTKSDQKSELGQQDASDVLLVHARGIVKAKTWYQKAVSVPLVMEEKLPTGRVKKAYRLQLGKSTWSFQLGSVPFALYETETSAQARLLPESIGDVRFSVIYYREVQLKKKFIGVDKAAQEAEKQLLEQLKSLPEDIKITRKKMDFALDSDEKNVIGTLTLEVIEDIGKEQMIY
ncbi:MAG: hypothetical protein PWQ97_798 [Tepidanaerobacteraceae bacterium]|nr:hypothetical protein [Tepidanaerobacteraceae bacterium]